MALKAFNLLVMYGRGRVSSLYPSIRNLLPPEAAVVETPGIISSDQQELQRDG